MRLRALITLLLLSLGSALALGPASATGSTYTVSVGGTSAPGTHTFTAASSGTISWGTPTMRMGCTSANIPASPTSVVGSGRGLVDLFNISKINWVGCTFAGGALLLQSAGWVFHGASAATTGTSDVIAGHIDQVRITVSNAICKFTVTGQAAANFNEATQRLIIAETGYSGRLKVSGAVGCLSQFTNGQAFDLSATFPVSSADGVIDIS
ncbi:hypothetical protein ASD11_16770 [Aeromicrobium sp. Root495]|uniref:hypothetical protein n=1 Tax=Aeromicrobium sp. Root495 TaxID=1736550 RepID=UPI0006F5701E|nr:hypothetical protein [Aeromicrobium sp. Root495]KQY56116.1 hypothetical protein ASD11_16770 [Aeromicrobium sp. Root495]